MMPVRGSLDFAVSGLQAFQKQPNMCAMNMRITKIFMPFLMLKVGDEKSE